MSKPKLFAYSRIEDNMQRISDVLGKNFEVHIWPHNRCPTDEEMKINVKGVYGIICNQEKIIDEKVLDAAGENLKVIVTSTAGYDHLDIKAIKTRGIRIGYEGCNVEATVTLAEHGIGLLLNVARCIINDHQKVQKNCHFLKGDLFDYNQYHTIWDSIVGIIGCGHTGTEIVKRLQAFSPKKILYCSRKQKLEVDALGGEWQSVDYICKNSDFIIITAQLNEETYHLLNRARLNSMKSNAILINIARGGIIDEKALVEVLQNEKIAGAGLDVTEEEPMQPSNPLLKLNNVVFTPHMAWCSLIAVRKKVDIVIENILAAYENREMPSELL